MRGCWNGIVREGAREFLVEAEVNFCLQSRAKAQEFLVVMVEKAIKVLDALEVVPEFCKSSYRDDGV